MLIKSLCDYYDMLSNNGKVLPEGYSSVKVHYLICLTTDGEIGDIINYQKKEEVKVGQKIKERWVPQEFLLPRRTEKSAIDSNIVEHRPLYIFGLNMDKNKFTVVDGTNKAEKSHKHFVEKNLSFIEALDSPIINAYRAFLEKWIPEEQTENQYLIGLGKDYSKSGFAFCLMGSPDVLLHEDANLKNCWEKHYSEKAADDGGAYIAQCGISGKKEPIARVHNKIKGIHTEGIIKAHTLVLYNNAAEQSYGNEQSFNSNISENAMKKYTEAMNYLLNGTKHKMIFDDMTILFWAMNTDGTCEDLFLSLLSGKSEQINAEQTEQMLKELWKGGKETLVSGEQIGSIDSIKENVDFYMIGLKPNSSRLSLKFIYRKKYAEILWNIAKFQQDIQMKEDADVVPLYRIKKELISPKSSSEKINPELMTKLFESIIYGKKYPRALLETVVRRIKTDGGDNKINATRVGIIKAYLNREYEKEAFKVGLDKQNKKVAYLCGRLFAVLEKIQQEASNNSLNRTIKDAYFASASSTPANIFPKLIILAQNHLNKVKSPIFYNKLIQEILGDFPGDFPKMVPLEEQGGFMIGYYQQYAEFFKKKEDKDA